MNKYYGVKIGLTPGIYTSWNDAKLQVNGYKGAIYKSFKTRHEAEFFINNIENSVQSREKILTELHNIDLLIYTDGSCKNYIGGYGIVVINNDNNKTEYYGHIPSPCTNQIAELTAIKIALSTISKNSNIHIRTDSMYAINCFTKYIIVWRKNGYITTKKEPIKNLELIKDIDQLMNDINVTFEHVYSHKGEYYNELADQLADKGRLLI